MVQCMETWLLADPQCLERFFGQHFQGGQLPQSKNLEKVAKKTVFDAIKEAFKKTQAGPYAKGEHSFALLAKIDPALVETESPWAKRFFDKLRNP